MKCPDVEGITTLLVRLGPGFNIPDEVPRCRGDYDERTLHHSLL